jgi:hypothetical protein
MKHLKISLQYLENYNFEDNSIAKSHWKFKGGDDIILKVPVSEQIFEEDAFGKGEHSYYEYPQESTATLVAMVMHYKNDSDLGVGCLYTVTGWEYISEDEVHQYESWEKPEILTIEELKLNLKKVEVAA